jgi:acetamidase/formamidase
MITPTLRGGHEVCTPVSIDKADVGDAVAIYIETIKVKSKAASSGVDEPIDGAFIGDSYVVKICPACETPWPDFKVEGIGQTAVRCTNCGEPTSPFKMVHGYTMIFDENRRYGVTVPEKMATTIAKKGYEYAALPNHSKQVPILLFGKADITGLVSRMRPFMGQLGTSPAVDVPDSHNAGDVGSFLINASHAYKITPEQYDRDLTDGHLDVDSVRAGAIVIAPVKVKGAGIYAGDAHALQGDGEVAGHTVDVTAELEITVEVLRGLTLEGPILIPLKEDLPPLAQPWDKDEWDQISMFARQHGIDAEAVAPLQIIGSGPTINAAAENGFRRAAKLFDMSIEEVRNRVTVTGAVEIGRLPGIVQVNMQVPIRVLEKLGLANIAIKHYKLPY